MSLKKESEIIEGIIETYENPLHNCFDPEELEKVEAKKKDKVAVGDLRICSRGKLQFCNKVINGVPYWSDLNL